MNEYNTLNIYEENMGKKGSFPSHEPRGYVIIQTWNSM